MSKEIGPPFKIITEPVHAGSNGYFYVETDPVHPKALVLKDHKARYVYLHRVVMENTIGRLLDDCECEQVDHKDGDKSNNKPENLEIKKRGPHQKEHVDRGNHFWKKSPRNKKRANEELSMMTYRVIKAFLS